MSYREIPEDRILKFPATPGFKGWEPFFTPDSTTHPAKMCLNLLRWMLETYTSEGDVVLDPMAGTGSTMVLASLLGRHGVAVEYEPRFCEMIRENIVRTERQATLTPKGNMICIQGDARNLTTVLKDAPFQLLSFEDKMIALSIGDGGIYIRGTTPHFYLEHSEKQEDYFKWKMKCLCTLKGKIEKRKRERKGKITRSIRFQSVVDERLRPIHSLLYPNGQKRITSKLLLKLKPEILAVWFMDDGSIDKRHNANITLSTDSFPKEDVIALSDWFFHKYGIESSAKKHGKGYVLFFLKTESYKLKVLLEPYFHQSMLYKMNVPSNVKWEKQKTEQLKFHISPSKLFELYWIEGKSTVEIARELDVHHSLVSQYLKRYHIPLRKGAINSTNFKQLDARELSKLLEESDAIITSPPYSHSETETGGEKGKRGGDSRQRVKKDYAEVSEGNIGLLTHGEVDSIVTSPPFGPSTRGGGIFKEGYTAPGEEEVSDPGLPERHSRPLSADPRNIDNLEYGEVDAVVTSPPYGNRLADDVVQDGDEARMSYRQAIDSIVTSPPYEEGLRHRGQNYEEVREKLLAQGYSEEYIRASWSQPHQCQRWAEEAYGEDERNIGNLKSESYLEAMLQCYREFYKVLKNPIDWCECGPTERSIKTRIETLHCVSHATRGFIMKYKVCPQCGKPQKPEDYNKNPLKHKPCLILVTKNFIRDKQVVRLDEDTIRLCEAAGFRLSDRWYFKLPQRSFWRILYKRRYPDVPEVEYEDVLVFKKESMLSRA